MDDDDSVRRLLSVQLGLAGHEVYIAIDGQGALDAIERETPDLVVLDVMMPVLDGWQVLAALRAKKEYATLPVILLTAKNSTEDIERSYTLGASLVMGKPYDGERLLQMIETQRLQIEILNAS